MTLQLWVDHEQQRLMVYLENGGVAVKAFQGKWRSLTKEEAKRMQRRHDLDTRFNIGTFCRGRELLPYDSLRKEMEHALGLASLAP